MPKIALIIIGAILFVAVAIGGYFLVIAIGETHEENMSNLEGFGSIVTPGGDGGTVDNSGVLAPSIGIKKISTTDKIIISLTEEKNNLIGELTAAKEQIKSLEAEVSLLTNYKENNERYAPRLMGEERDFAVKSMTQYLDATPEAEQFTEFQRNVMVEQSANVYLDVVRRFHLNITDEDRDKLLKEFLPAYAFCIGNDIGLVANSRAEQSRLLKYFKSMDKSLLDKTLLEDIKTIEAPCLSRLNDQVLPYFRADLN